MNFLFLLFSLGVTAVLSGCFVTTPTVNQLDGSRPSQAWTIHQQYPHDRDCLVPNITGAGWVEVVCSDRTQFCDPYKVVWKQGKWVQIINPGCDQSRWSSRNLYDDYGHWSDRNRSDRGNQRNDSWRMRDENVAPRQREITRPKQRRVEESDKTIPRRGERPVARQGRTVRD